MQKNLEFGLRRFYRIRVPRRAFCADWLDLETGFSPEEQRAIKLFKMTIQKWPDDPGVNVDADTKARL